MHETGEMIWQQEELEKQSKRTFKAAIVDIDRKSFLEHK